MNSVEEAGSEGSLREEFEASRGWIAATTFLVIELVLIFAYGSSFYGDYDPDLTDPDGMNQFTWMVLSFSGYFLLGLIGGNWKLLPVAFLPVVLSFPAGIPDGAYAEPGSEPFPLFFNWALLMVLFLPVWAAGVLVAKFWARRRSKRQ